VTVLARRRTTRHRGRPRRHGLAGGCALIAAGCLLPIATGGCARPAGEIFPTPDRARVWPLPPDKPRIRFVGVLRGEEDLKAPQSAWQGLQRALHAQERKPVHLVTPESVAVSDDDVVYVADTGAPGLQVLDLNRRTALTARAVDENRSLSSPVGVALGKNGVFVSDAALKDVFEFSFQGEFVRRLGLDVGRPGGIAYCAKVGHLYVVDTSRHECLIVDEDGTRVGSFGTRGTGAGELNFPTHVTCSALLGVLISDTLNFRVSRFGMDGSFVRSFGKKGDAAGDFALPKGVAVDSEGHVYVADAQFENVQVFRDDGQLLMAFGEEGSAPGEFAIPGGLTIDRRDRIWVADAYNHRLQVFQYLAGSEG